MRASAGMCLQLCSCTRLSRLPPPTARRARLPQPLPKLSREEVVHNIQRSDACMGGGQARVYLCTWRAPPGGGGTAAIPAGARVAIKVVHRLTAHGHLGDIEDAWQFRKAGERPAARGGREGLLACVGLATAGHSWGQVAGAGEPLTNRPALPCTLPPRPSGWPRSSPPDEEGRRGLRVELHTLNALHAHGCGGRMVRPLGCLSWGGEWSDDAAARAGKWFRVSACFPRLAWGPRGTRAWAAAVPSRPAGDVQTRAPRRDRPRPAASPSPSSPRSPPTPT